MSKVRIFEAVKHLDLKSTSAMLEAKPVLLKATDRQGRTLLHVACSADCAGLGVPEAESARIVNFLLDRGLETDIPIGRDKVTPLFAAVARGRNRTLVKLLLKRGANVKSAPGGGLFAAGWWDDVEMLELLIRAGAQIDIVVGVTPFLATWCWGKFDAAKVLALSGANVNYQDPRGRTALLHGVEREFDPAMLTWLVKHGASPDIVDRDGVSARLKASRKRDKKFFTALS
ncbi:MAG TPA: ankyrin repeat domain-containing protein [Vicinamibacterales bacterium]|nr:ankyrin repeat domain-containing protein [Vicinamibacterales bacterium]